MLFRERQQITICVVAAVTIGGFMLLRYLPLRSRMKAAEQTRAAQTLAIGKGTADGRQLPLLKEQLLKLRIRLGNYEVNVPNESNVGGFLGSVADLMKEHSLTEQVIEPGEEIEADKFRCIPVRMLCKGKLIQIFEFYQRLQSLDRLVRIEQVKLRNDSDFNGEVSMETKAVIYYRAEIGQG
jgi:Tfp pilus assembly protein PilO